MRIVKGLSMRSPRLWQAGDRFKIRTTDSLPSALSALSVVLLSWPSLGKVALWQVITGKAGGSSPGRENAWVKAVRGGAIQVENTCWLCVCVHEKRRLLSNELTYILKAEKGV